MRHILAEEIDAALNFPELVDALAAAFVGGIVAPPRHHHALERPGYAKATMLLMPAWSAPDAGEAFLGVKLVNVFPSNAALGLPAVNGVYVLQSGVSGLSLASLDGTRLTHWRTAAASALAARYLARVDARKLLIVGAGALAPFLARAHASVRPIEHISVWNHRREGAQALVDQLRQAGFPAALAQDLEPAVREADIISCATLSATPLVLGAWLNPGQHVDLVGAFDFAGREADDAALHRARVFVDTPAALIEGGDVAQALRSGAMSREHVLADLPGLIGGAIGRTSPEDITLFKSIGAAVEDLAAAMLVWRKVRR